MYNALNQVSLWGPQGQITDYAVKQWAGQVSDYLLPRWDKFGRALVDCLAEGKAFDQLAFGEDLFKTVEEPFTKNVNRTFSSEPIGRCSGRALVVFGWCFGHTYMFVFGWCFGRIRVVF